MLRFQYEKLLYIQDVFVKEFNSRGYSVKLQIHGSSSWLAYNHVDRGVVWGLY